MFPILARTNDTSLYNIFANFFSGFGPLDYQAFGAKYAVGLFIIIGAGHLISRYGGKGWREEANE